MAYVISEDVLLAELVLTSVRLALSLKVIFTQLILSSVQIVVLAQMYVLLKQFTQLNNTIPNNKDKAAFLMESSLYLFLFRRLANYNRVFNR